MLFLGIAHLLLSMFMGHKHACLPEDPASAKRGDNIYLFILKAICNEHIDGWKRNKTC